MANIASGGQVGPNAEPRALAFREAFLRVIAAECEEFDGFDKAVRHAKRATRYHETTARLAWNDLVWRGVTRD